MPCSKVQYSQCEYFTLNAIFTRATLHIAQSLPSCGVRLSVRPLVCHTPVLCLNGWTYLKAFRGSAGSPIILVFWVRAPTPNSKGIRGTSSAGLKIHGEVLRFSTEIAACLRNGRSIVRPTIRNINRKSKVADYAYVGCDDLDYEWPTARAQGHCIPKKT